LALFLLLVAFDTSFFTELLALTGMESRVARIAGSRLSVMAALVGAGLLLISLSSWARNARMLTISSAHADMLEHLVQENMGRVEILPGVGAAFTGEVAGLRVEIVVEPTHGGQAWIRALCPASRPLHIWPRGLAPESTAAHGFRVSQGPSWEAWSTAEGMLHGDVMQPVEDAFFDAGVSEIQHNRSGVELSMSNAPGDSLMKRITLGLNVAAALSRSNR